MTSDAAETGSATNGQQTVYPPKTTFPLLSGSSQSLTYGGQGVGIGNGTGPGASCSASASISLTFTVTGTWQGPGPCPSTVYLLETSSALYHGYAQSGSTSSQNNPSAADGLGDPANPTDPLSGTSTGALVTSVPVTGNSWTITRTLSAASDCTANFPPTSGGGGMEADVGIGRYTVGIFSVSLSGYSTVDTAGWDPMHPRFFSGTDRSATGTAVAASGYIKQATLSLGGTAVKYYYDTSMYGPFPVGTTQGTNQSSTPLSVVFDSTHFADTAPVSIQMTVTDSGGFTC